MHALLGASKAHIYLNCTPSARYAERYPDTGSVYAAEGTAAHALAEVRLGEALDTLGIPCEWSHTAADTDNEYYGPDMEDYVAEYVTQVLEHISALESPHVMLEQRLDFSDYVPSGYGTGDVVILSDRTLEIIDLKYGKGVAVEADHNPQLMLYGLGAYLTYGQIYGIDTVRVTIAQPRLDALSTYELPADELLRWAEETVRPLAQQAWDGTGEFTAGDWCRFCTGRTDCKARADKNVELAQETFGRLNVLSNAEIADILTQLPQWTAWANEIQDSALDRALKGEEFPGWKVVRGRSNRKYDDEPAIEAALQAADIAPDKYSKRTLIGITDMTKLLGKKKFEALVGPYIVKPPGKPKLAPDTDKRPAMSGAKEAADTFSQFSNEGVTA